MVNVSVSIGELIDKWTILKVKIRNIKDQKKLALVMRELEILNDIVSPYLHDKDHGVLVSDLTDELLKINQTLWDTEDFLRGLESKKIPAKLAYYLGEDDGMLTMDEIQDSMRFVELARQVYFTNDARAKLKWRINMLLKSGIVEVKDYDAYSELGD